MGKHRRISRAPSGASTTRAHTSGCVARPRRDCTQRGATRAWTAIPPRRAAPISSSPTPTARVHLGRPTAPAPFTRNNNRGSRHATAGKLANLGSPHPLLRSLFKASQVCSNQPEFHSLFKASLCVYNNFNNTPTCVALDAGTFDAQLNRRRHNPCPTKSAST